MDIKAVSHTYLGDFNSYESTHDNNGISCMGIRISKKYYLGEKPHPDFGIMDTQAASHNLFGSFKYSDCDSPDIGPKRGSDISILLERERFTRLFLFLCFVEFFDFSFLAVDRYIG